jgi:acetyl esterase/lipase
MPSTIPDHRPPAIRAWTAGRSTTRAGLTGLLTGLRAPDGKATEERPLVFDFAVIVGGYPSIDPDHAVRYAAQDSFAVPSLHIIGRTDSVVPPAKSFDLAAKFSHPVIVEHSGGHVVASTPTVRTAYREFLNDMLNSRPAPPTAPLEVSLWPDRGRPAMTVVFPERKSRRPVPAVVVFQGGAYATSAGSGAGSAEWIAQQGMVGVRVAYRTQGTLDAFPANYADASRAIRLVRARAAEWNIDPDRVGVLGYSAGGHLASLVSTQPDLPPDEQDDLADLVSARPDLVILGYPLISFVERYSAGAFANSADNFFGRPRAPESLRRDFSNELHVDRTHPPVFVWTTRDDPLVPYTHAQLFAEACQKAQVPVRFELFPHGRHGLGLALDQTSEVRGWTGQLRTWLREQWGDN